MSKKHKAPQTTKTDQASHRSATRATAAPDNGDTGDNSRRKFMLLGLGTAAVAGVAAAGAYNAGWFGGDPAPANFQSTAPRAAGKNLTPVTLPADPANALRAIHEMIEHYARDLDNPSTLIHAVRAFGKGFKRADGSSAAAHLCTRYAADKDVNGKRYVYFQRDAEVHENSFLKTFLEAGVSLDQRVTTANGGQYTLRDVAEHGKQLFRCDVNDLYKFDDRQFRYDPSSTQANGRGELVHEHLPWGLIAFANLMKPAEAKWSNAYGETIDFAAVLDRALAEYESTCSLGQADIVSGQGAPAAYREKIKTYSCFGLHSVYGFLACWQHGYTNNNVPKRVAELLDLVSYRLQADVAASDREYDEADQKAAAQGQKSPPQLLAAFKLRARVKLYGHAFESVNFAKLHKLVAFTPAQEKRLQAGEQAMYETIVQLRALDFGTIRKTLGDKFISDLVIALGHAARGMKLLTPENPDTLG